jgi:hypothetical protein
VTYTHDGSETTSDVFTYTIRDAEGAISNVASVNLTITPANDAPTATAESYALTEDAALAVGGPAGVLADESDAEGDALTAILLSGPSNAASFNLNPDGSFDYVPSADFAGTDQFTYTVGDGVATGGVVATTLTVLPVNDAPRFDLTSQPTAGHLELAASPGVAVTSFTQDDLDAGRLLYVLDDPAAPSDSFSFVVSDPGGASIGQAFFEIAVSAPPGQEPVDPTDGHTDEDTTTKTEEPDDPAPAPEVSDGGEDQPLEFDTQPPTSPVDFIIKTRTALRFDGSTAEVLDTGSGPLGSDGLFNARTLGDDRGATPDAAAMSPLGLERLVEQAVGQTWDHSDLDSGDGRDLKIWIARSEAIVMSAGLGFVAALLRGGSLVALTASSLPLWKGLDPVAALLVSERRRERLDDELRFARHLEDETDDVGRVLDDEGEHEGHDPGRRRPGSR